MTTRSLLFFCLFSLPCSLCGEKQVENVLFLISDDLKASVLGCYGDKVCKTPNIDKLAAHAVVFERAYCQGTSCGPSRTSFMHSRYKGKGEVNLGQHFRENGFYSARVGKIYHMRVPGDIIAGTDGLDIPSSWTEKFNSQGQEAHTPGNYACLNLNIFTKELKGRQSTRMPHRMFVSVSYEGNGSDQPDHKTATKMIGLLRKHGEKPFFLAAGFVRPHYPMVQPKQYFDPYPWQKMTPPKSVPDDLDDMPKLAIPKSRSALNGIDKYPDNQKRMWSSYYASVSFMDEQVGRVLDELDRLGLREKTAIVFTSDHGYHLGEHTFWQKNNLHEEVLRVPLIISVPGSKAGRSKSIVELMDLFPTLSELAGLRIPKTLQGVSLAPILADKSATVKESALSFVSAGISMRSKDWTFTRYADGSEELYDMSKDRGQFTNLVKDSKFGMVLKKQRAAFDQRIAAAGIKVKKSK
ncbi:MAG: sulfatase [Roseibacillus sp.]